ncbi:unnamed protein product [Schistocephalus solidus]|uniref:Zinc transporter ZIP1 n=1 Tax=Schistocephalus solidus TaxID=70667 RepID=A0A183TAD0_SCHSO|nr:unnamed protein product [Schistocephalus solidus]
MLDVLLNLLKSRVGFLIVKRLYADPLWNALRVAILVVCFFVSANALHAGVLFDPGDHNSTLEPSPDQIDFGRLGFVKMGIALAMFISVLIACGLPILILDCIQKRTDAAACSLTPLSRNGHGVSSFSACSTPLDAPVLRAPPITGDVVGVVDVGTNHGLHTMESTQLLTGNGDLYEGNSLSPPETHPFEAQWSSTGPSGSLLQPVTECKTLRRRRIYRRRRAIQLWTSRITCFAAGVFLSTGKSTGYSERETSVKSRQSRALLAGLPYQPQSHCYSCHISTIATVRQIGCLPNNNIGSAFSGFRSSPLVVILMLGFMDLFPDVEEAVTAALSSLGVHLKYPLSSLFTLVGFFTVLLVEQTVIVCHKHHSPDTPNLPHDSSMSNASQAESSGVTADLSAPELSDTPQVTFVDSVEGGLQEPQHDSDQAYHNPQHHHHLAMGQNSGSIMRVFLLLIALCVHSVFEGLAVGLQRSVSEVVALFSALMLHKLIMAVSIGMSLATSRQQSERTGAAPNCKTLRIQVACTTVFALASPLGVLIGSFLVAQRSSGALLMTIAVLQGLACGTFFFVVFCEMLPNEFKEGSGDRILKFIFLLLGFVLVAVYLVFEPK